MSDNEQESEKRETVADILAEMHKESKKERTVTRPDGYGGYEEITLEGNPYLKNLADRLEAAWEREREELYKRISDLEAYAKLWTDRADELRLKCDEFYAKAKPFGNAAAMREALETIHDKVNSLDEECGVDPVEIRDLARAALTEPPRQCDVGTAEEQGERCMAQFDQWRRKGDGRKLITAIMAWAQTPYEKQEGAGNERR